MKGPPPYLQIFREGGKSGRVGPHPATEAGWPRAFAKAKISNHYIAMTTLYGPDEAWFCQGNASIAEIEQQNQVENLIFSVSPEMSYPLPEWVAQDPEFWGRKPTASPTAAPSKPGS